MKAKSLCSILLLCRCGFTATAQVETTTWLRTIPMTFESAAVAPYVARASGQLLWFEASGAVTIGGPGGIRMTLEGANPDARMEYTGTLEGTSNYLIGDSGMWSSGVRMYSGLTYRGVYPGVDLLYYGTRQGLEYDFVLAPGASYRNIRLRFQGVTDLEVASTGDLVITGKDAGGPRLRHRGPRIYQDTAHGRKELSGSYIRLEEYTVGFDVSGASDHLALVIDPVIAYSTYLGGTGDDRIYGIAVDTAGAIYVAGSTWSSDLPGASAIQNGAVSGRGRQVFVTKFHPDRRTIVYSTYIGGSRDEAASSIAVSPDGYAFIAGSTSSSDFPVTAGSWRHSFRAQEEAFVLKLDPTGKTLVYSTFLGGGGSNRATGLRIDQSGNCHITGYTNSVDFPTTSGAAQANFGGGFFDAFAAALNASGSALLYGSYLGGNGSDVANAIAIDALGNVYVTGATDSTNFPVRSPLQATGGQTDAFVSKFNTTGKLVYSTFLGGRSTDSGAAIAVDSNGQAYVAGSTSSPDFPITSGSLQTSKHGDYDVFVAKLRTDGASLIYSTYIGGTGAESASALTVTPYGCVLLTGSTRSFDFPLVSPIQASAKANGEAFVTALAPGGNSLIFSSYLGGSGEDSPTAVAYHSGRTYVAGFTLSPDFHTTVGSLRTYPAGSVDSFVTILDMDLPPLVVSVTPSSGSGNSQTFTAIFSDPDGYDDLVNTVLIINSSLSGYNACYVIYERSRNTVALVNDTATAVTVVRLGSSDTAQNNQCGVSGAVSSASFSGTTLTVNLALTFQPAFAGNKSLYLYATDQAGLNSGVALGGTWTTGIVNRAPSVVALTPSSGSGTSQTFSAVFSDPNGYDDLAGAVVIINSSLNGYYACYLIYDPFRSAVALVNDSATAVTLVRLGSTDTAHNSQCTITGSGSSASSSGDMLTLNLALTFYPAFDGTRSIYLYTWDRGGLSSGPVLAGTWAIGSINRVPSAVSWTPASGSGTGQTFSAVFSDPDGYDDLAGTTIIINSGLNGYRACYLIYDRGTSTVALVNDEANAITSVRLGSADKANNSQCALAGAQSSVSLSGTTLTLNLALTFHTAFAGTKNVYLYTRDRAGLDSGAPVRGVWTVP